MLRNRCLMRPRERGVAELTAEFFKRYYRAIGARDFGTLETMFHPDFVGEYPQSGERFRGFRSFRSQLEHYSDPQPLTGQDELVTKVLGDEERWAITPGYTVVPLAGPQQYTTISRARYPDGSYWRVVSIMTLRDGLIAHSETYFAPEFEPPEWRSDLAERVPPPEVA